MKSISKMNIRERWIEFERRKSLLWSRSLSPEEYESEIRKISEDLGI
ncbi:MAG: hypothetical protein VST70_06880 [Nitrospirota bacterium]|nr:hypothetical protein [Nitrospirota bacterium]